MDHSKRTSGFRFLVAESEPPEARDTRRESVGRSSGETCVETLLALSPGATCRVLRPAEADAALGSGETLSDYDGVFLSGSPLHLWEETPETRRTVAFMRGVFASGTPSFGSCAGLQVATVAAGGSVREMRSGHEAAFARRITRTAEGRDHPLLAGRPDSYDAPAVHTDEVEALPQGARHLAGNRVTTVQAAEIVFDGGVFWGVQYHPEIGLDEVAGAVRRQADALVRDGLATDLAAVEAHAARIDALHRDPGRNDLRWMLGLDDEVVDAGRRSVEMHNFIQGLVVPNASARGRG